MNNLEFKINNTTYYLDYDKFKYEQLWLKFREQTLSLTGFGPSSESVKKAEEYLINKYPEYSIFK